VGRPPLSVSTRASSQTVGARSSRIKHQVASTEHSNLSRDLEPTVYVSVRSLTILSTAVRNYRYTTCLTCIGLCISPTVSVCGILKTSRTKHLLFPPASLRGRQEMDFHMSRRPGKFGQCSDWVASYMACQLIRVRFL
jgi:hypothetical protein